MAILDDAKLTLRVVTTTFDSEISDLIESAKSDLGVVGVDTSSTTLDPLVKRAILTYVRTFFGEPDDFERIKKCYDEQKAQLRTIANYRVDEDGQE